MLLTWLKKILGLHVDNPSSNIYDDGHSQYTPNSTLDDLEEKKKYAQEEKESIIESDYAWFSLKIQTKKNKFPKQVYTPLVTERIPTLQFLKEKRLQKEADELRKLEDSVIILLDKLNVYLSQKNEIDAALIIKELSKNKIIHVKDKSIKKRFDTLQKSFLKLQNELERERLIKLAEERKRKEEEALKRKEAEEIAKRNEEKRLVEEYIKRQQEAERLIEIARKKEKEELEEKLRLESISNDLKENWRDFKNVLDNNDVKYLFHFTDKRNIPSIKRYGGLLSWYYCREHNITIPCQGGDYSSQMLDKRYGLEDYVRLSFCENHPMAYRLKQSGSNIVILKIKADVALLKHTLFSDINAADQLHSHGGTLNDLYKIKFSATKRRFVSRSDEDFKFHQAEVMVKTFVPKKYIINLDTF